MRMKITMSVLAAGIALGLLVPANAQGQGKLFSRGCNATTFNVHSILADTDSNKLPLEIQSDGAGAYSNSSTDTTTSYIGGFTCQWDLDTTNSSRTIRLTLDPQDPLQSGPFNGTQNIHAQVISRCQDSSGNAIDWTTMPLNGENNCSLSTTFSYRGKSYTLKVNPNTYPGSTWVQVMCTGVSSNLCNMWTVTPVASPLVINPTTGQSAAIGELFQALKGGKTQSIGFYYIDLSATITNP